MLDLFVKYYELAIRKNNKDYVTKYASDFSKGLPRIPVVKDKEKYVGVGRKLMDLHVNYENVPIYDGVDIEGKSDPSYVVKKMKFARAKTLKQVKLKMTVLQSSSMMTSQSGTFLKKLMNMLSTVVRRLNGLWISTRLKLIRSQVLPMTLTTSVMIQRTSSICY